MRIAECHFNQRPILLLGTNRFLFVLKSSVVGSREAFESHSMKLSMNFSTHVRSIVTVSTNFSSSTRSAITSFVYASQSISIGRVRSPSMSSSSSARQFGSCAIPVFDQIVPPSRRETT